MKTYSIKETAELMSLSQDTLRYYDKIQLLNPERKENGYRFYTDANLQDLRCIAVLKIAGFKLEDIQHFMMNRRSTETVDEYLQDSSRRLLNQSQEIEKQIEVLTHVKILLETYSAYVAGLTECAP